MGRRKGSAGESACLVKLPRRIGRRICMFGETAAENRPENLHFW